MSGGTSRSQNACETSVEMSDDLPTCSSPTTRIRTMAACALLRVRAVVVKNTSSRRARQAAHALEAVCHVEGNRHARLKLERGRASTVTRQRHRASILTVSLVADARHLRLCLAFPHPAAHGLLSLVSSH